MPEMKKPLEWKIRSVFNKTPARQETRIGTIRKCNIVESAGEFKHMTLGRL